MEISYSLHMHMLRGGECNNGKMVQNYAWLKFGVLMIPGDSYDLVSLLGFLYRIKCLIRLYT